MLLHAAGLVLAGALSINLAVALATTALRRPLARLRTVEPEKKASPGVFGASAPFVSVHVATYDEPPAMVIATLEALLRSDYPAFEVVVLDNNTPSPAVWRPVQAYAARCDPRVRFFHVEGVAGAKAGALNLALARADPRTEYVAVVDADYLVAPDFLARGVAACGPDVQFVQFPQAYRHAEGAGSVVAELSDYFETFPRAANRAQAALLTGTLSVIAAPALRAAGGWPTGSLTEDAELGVRLWSRGARGLYLPDRVGHGLLPLDLAGLRLQRRRWARGNMQTLLTMSRTTRRPREGALAVVAQLTAWIGWLCLPLLGLVAAAGVRALGDETPWAWRAVEGLASATIACVLAGHAARALTCRRPGQLAVTLSLLWTSSFSWLAIFGGRVLPFQRTPKLGPGARRSARPSLDTVFSGLALATAGVLLAEGAFFAPLMLASSATGLLTAPFTDRALRRAALSRNLSCKA